MKIHIFYHFTEGPYGGANTFLKYLKKYLLEKKVYTDDVASSDIVLFNSHSLGAGKGDVFIPILKLKKKYPDKIFVHRVDGPIDFHRDLKNEVDQKIYRINKLLADATIFVSNWSKKNNLAKGMQKTALDSVIHNSSDPKIFYPPKNKDSKLSNNSKKIKIVTSTWSKNDNKGFAFLSYLDKNLDFNKFEFTMIGRSDEKFENIKQTGPLKLEDVGGELRKNDIFFFGGRHESCSNSIIEALSCGLPVLYPDSGANREIVDSSGFAFKNGDDLVGAIDLILNQFLMPNFEKKSFSRQNAGEEYFNFFNYLLEKQNKKQFCCKKVNTAKLIFESLKYSLW